MTQQHKRGDTREDGYIFLRYQFNDETGKSYPVFISPFAYKAQLKRVSEWRAANKDKVAAYKAAWCKENPDKVAKYQKAWRKKKKPTA